MKLAGLLAEDVTLRELEPDIFTVLSDSETGHHYDRLAAGYDLIIGNSLYNRLLWGNWVSDYTDFCRQAVESDSRGHYLDVGCGTLVFSAEVYAGARRPIVLMDRSLGMLRKARKRLRALCGEVPAHISLIQGDAYQLPFLDGQFATVASFGVLHLFDDVGKLVTELQRVGSKPGSLWLSSLVRERGIGRYYYDLLVRSGEIATVRTALDVEKIVAEATEGELTVVTRGNMTTLRVT